MKSIPFTKMHGCGNDYIYINLFDKEIRHYLSNKSNLAQILSNRHFGIGGDGVIFISPSSIADFKMEIYNADGSFAEMCGNGIRCAAVFARNEGIFPKDKKEIIVESSGTFKHVEFIQNDSTITNVKVNMGKPEFHSKMIPVISDKPFIIQEPLTISIPNISSINETLPIRTYLYDITCVSMGNPHCVIFTDDVSKIDLEYIGPFIERHEMFPNRTNIEFVQVITPTLLKMRVWERGSGETLACGTGCCASLAAGMKNHLTSENIIVQVPGGELVVECDKESDDIFLTGPVVPVFDGNIIL